MTSPSSEHEILKAENLLDELQKALSPEDLRRFSFSVVTTLSIFEDIIFRRDRLSRFIKYGEGLRPEFALAMRESVFTLQGIAVPVVRAAHAADPHFFEAYAPIPAGEKLYCRETTDFLERVHKALFELPALLEQ